MRRGALGGAALLCLLSRAAAQSVTTLAGSLASPFGAVVAGSAIIVSDSSSSSNRLRNVSVADGTVSTLAGGCSGTTNGVGSNACFGSSSSTTPGPAGLALSPDGMLLYIAECVARRARRSQAARSYADPPLPLPQLVQ